MRKLIALAAIATMLVPSTPMSASASYWSQDSRCVLTNDGRVSLRGSISNSDGSYAYYGPIRWVYRVLDLDASTGWTRLHVGFRESVTVEPDGEWVATFASYPMPRDGFAYKLIVKPTGWRFTMTRYNDNKENPYCRTRAA